MSAPRNAVMWAEIPVVDMNRAKAFYAAVLERELIDESGGPNPMAAFTTAAKDGVAGHLYPGTPAPEGVGPTVHFAAPGRLEATMERVREAGGTVVGEPVEIPVGRFCYALDPDGNSIGLFEA